MRNFNDAFIYIGLFYDFAINLYLLSDLNIAKEIMFDSQTKLIKQLLALNIVQFIVFLSLKSISMNVQEETEKEAPRLDRRNSRSSVKLSSLASVRKKSCIDGSSCLCMGNKCRNLTMFIAIGVVFFVLPVMMLVLAFSSQFSSPAELATDESAAGATAMTSAGGNQRML